MDKKEKIKDLEEMIQVVLLRIPKEIEAKNFYLSAARRTKSEVARDLFNTLAQQEKGHEAELRRILKHLQTELQESKGA